MGRHKGDRWWSSSSDDYEYDDPDSEGTFIRCDYDQDGNLMGYEEANLGSDRKTKSWLLRFRDWVHSLFNPHGQLEFYPQRGVKIEETEDGLYERHHSYSYVTAGEDVFDCLDHIEVNEDRCGIVSPHIKEWQDEDYREGLNIFYSDSAQDELIEKYGAEAYLMKED